jgi:hypothetical protein
MQKYRLPDSRQDGISPKGRRGWYGAWVGAGASLWHIHVKRQPKGRELLESLGRCRSQFVAHSVPSPGGEGEGDLT